MMPWPPTRSGRIANDGLRSCATPHGWLCSRFRGRSGFPLDAGPPRSIRRNGVMGQFWNFALWIALSFQATSIESSLSSNGWTELLQIRDNCYPGLNELKVAEGNITSC